MDWRPLLVEFIRQLWDRGLYRDNPWLRRIVDNYMELWVDWRTGMTMEEVDRQVTILNPEPVKLTEPTFTETLEGETPLGGEMRLFHGSPEKDNA